MNKLNNKISITGSLTTMLCFEHKVGYDPQRQNKQILY